MMVFADPIITLNDWKTVVPSTSSKNQPLINKDRVVEPHLQVVVYTKIVQNNPT